MKIVALAGGVGGAKLVNGLAQILPPENLTVIVNTGDDFSHWGLYISPDIDTICYTLAGIANPEHGWGRADDTFNVFENVRKLGGEDWFLLGDRDLANHIVRSELLENENTLAEITEEFCRCWDIRVKILPMSNEPIRTMVNTIDHGELPFQEYFVHLKCKPRVSGFSFAGIETAQPTPGTLEAIQDADGIILCPSNPWVSIDPILSVKGIRSAIEKKTVIAVSPIVGGKAIKGPAAKMFLELSISPTPLAVAEHYGSLISKMVIDSMDAILAPAFSIPIKVTDTIMDSPQKQLRLAQDVLNLIRI